MILVKRNSDDSTQKVISSFLKRVKKSNLVARKRKIKHFSKDISDLKAKGKAIKKADYISKQAVLDRVGKK